MEGITTLTSHGHLIASGSKDNTVRVWDTNNLTCLCTLQLHSAPISFIRWVSQSVVITADESGSILMWDLRNYDQPTRFEVHRHSITAIEVISPTFFISGDSTGTVVFWGDKRCQRNTHGACIDAITHLTGAAGTTDGIIVVTAADQRLRLWSSTGELLKDVRISFNFKRDQRWSISHLAAGADCSIYVGLDQFACDTEMEDAMVVRLVYDVKQGFTQEHGFAAKDASTHDSIGRVTCMHVPSMSTSLQPSSSHCLLFGCEKKYVFVLEMQSLQLTSVAEGPLDGVITDIANLVNNGYVAVTARGEVLVKIGEVIRDVRLPTRDVTVVSG